MCLAIVVDQRYWRTPDGSFWTRMPPDYRFFERHLTLFSSVRVIARTMPAAEPPEGALRADGDGVEFSSVDGYRGPSEFLRRIGHVTRSVSRGASSCGSLLLRIPSNLANCLIGRESFGVEVLGDPADLYAPEASRAFLRPIYRAWFVANLRHQCRRASVAAYVSQRLARRYPSRSSHVLLDIDLPEEAFATVPRQVPQLRRAEIVTAGAFDHPVKGHDVLIESVALLGEQGVAARLTIVGGGRMQQELASLAASRGVAVRFTGELGGSAQVREVFNHADLFALASRSEGKPRALIEALSLGLPAVATSVGGIPEVLPPEQLVARDDAHAFAAKLRDTLRDPLRYKRLSVEGIKTARRYARAAEWERRREFLRELKANARPILTARSLHGLARS